MLHSFASKEQLGLLKVKILLSIQYEISQINGNLTEPVVKWVDYQLYFVACFAACFAACYLLIEMARFQTLIETGD